ncbi:hypothetical protein HELRODRAFT_193140 [Helobdella robusta]|uniref:HP domain-containing protein n=1 Tax=Helobdella robusta TaxID=6412 RepID=T1FUN4_HELRO|nr:hypothetical protein HELRODRAFT_193140 [Helobdella robusta]ESN97912.1 hypothetical protein HELRODRAFT_193140 [Helobdella robusta]
MARLVLFHRACNDCSRPRYHKSRSSYTSRDLLASHKRPESTDGCLEHVRSAPYTSSSAAAEDYDRRECSSSVCDRFSQYSSRTDLDDVPVQSGSKLNKFPRMDGRSTPISLLSHQFYSIHRSIVTSVDKDDANIKTYPYEVLKVTSLNRPAHLDDENLEQYLEEETFEWLLGMDRAEFYHLPAWKRNDMKKRIELFK